MADIKTTIANLTSDYNKIAAIKNSTKYQQVIQTANTIIATPANYTQDQATVAQTFQTAFHSVTDIQDPATYVASPDNATASFNAANDTQAALNTMYGVLSQVNNGDSFSTAAYNLYSALNPLVVDFSANYQDFISEQNTTTAADTTRTTSSVIDAATAYRAVYTTLLPYKAGELQDQLISIYPCYKAVFDYLDDTEETIDTLSSHISSCSSFATDGHSADAATALSNYNAALETLLSSIDEYQAVSKTDLPNAPTSSTKSVDNSALAKVAKGVQAAKATSTPDVAPEKWGVKFSVTDSVGTAAIAGSVTKAYYFTLLPAMASSLHLEGSRDVPNAGPGLSFKIVPNLGKFKIPGFQPVYQNLGIDTVMVTMVGAFTGADGGNDIIAGPFTEPLNKSLNSYAGRDGTSNPKASLANIIKQQEHYDAYRNLQEFYNYGILSSREFTVEINLNRYNPAPLKGTEGKLRTAAGNCKFKGVIKDMQAHYTRNDRVWYSIVMEVSDCGLISDKPINLTNDIQAAITQVAQQQSAAATARRNAAIKMADKIAKAAQQDINNAIQNNRSISKYTTYDGINVTCIEANDTNPRVCYASTYDPTIGGTVTTTVDHDTEEKLYEGSIPDGSFGSAAKFEAKIIGEGVACAGSLLATGGSAGAAAGLALATCTLAYNDASGGTFKLHSGDDGRYRPVSTQEAALSLLLVVPFIPGTGTLLKAVTANKYGAVLGKIGSGGLFLGSLPFKVAEGIGFIGEKAVQTALPFTKGFFQGWTEAKDISLLGRLTGAVNNSGAVSALSKASEFVGRGPIKGVNLVYKGPDRAIYNNSIYDQFIKLPGSSNLAQKNVVPAIEPDPTITFNPDAANSVGKFQLDVNQDHIFTREDTGESVTLGRGEIHNLNVTTDPVTGKVTYSLEPSVNPITGNSTGSNSNKASTEIPITPKQLIDLHPNLNNPPYDFNVPSAQPNSITHDILIDHSITGIDFTQGSKLEVTPNAGGDLDVKITNPTTGAESTGTITNAQYAQLKKDGIIDLTGVPNAPVAAQNTNQTPPINNGGATGSNATGQNNNPTSGPESTPGEDASSTVPVGQNNNASQPGGAGSTQQPINGAPPPNDNGTIYIKYTETANKALEAALNLPTDGTGFRAEVTPINGSTNYKVNLLYNDPQGVPQTRISTVSSRFLDNQGGAFEFTDPSGVPQAPKSLAQPEVNQPVSPGDTPEPVNTPTTTFRVETEEATKIRLLADDSSNSVYNGYYIKPEPTGEFTIYKYDYPTRTVVKSTDPIANQRVIDLYKSSLVDPSLTNEFGVIHEPRPGDIPKISSPPEEPPSTEIPEGTGKPAGKCIVGCDPTIPTNEIDLTNTTYNVDSTTLYPNPDGTTIVSSNINLTSTDGSNTLQVGNLIIDTTHPINIASQTDNILLTYSNSTTGKLTQEVVGLDTPDAISLGKLAEQVGATDLASDINAKLITKNAAYVPPDTATPVQSGYDTASNVDYLQQNVTNNDATLLNRTISSTNNQPFIKYTVDIKPDILGSSQFLGTEITPSSDGLNKVFIIRSPDGVKVFDLGNNSNTLYKPGDPNYNDVINYLNNLDITNIGTNLPVAANTATDVALANTILNNTPPNISTSSLDSISNYTFTNNGNGTTQVSVNGTVIDTILTSQVSSLKQYIGSTIPSEASIKPSSINPGSTDKTVIVNYTTESGYNGSAEISTSDIKKLISLSTSPVKIKANIPITNTAPASTDEIRVGAADVGSTPTQVKVPASGQNGSNGSETFDPNLVIKVPPKPPAPPKLPDLPKSVGDVTSQPVVNTPPVDPSKLPSPTTDPTQIPTVDPTSSDDEELVPPTNNQTVDDPGDATNNINPPEKKNLPAGNPITRGAKELGNKITNQAAGSITKFFSDPNRGLGDYTNFLYLNVERKTPIYNYFFSTNPLTSDQLLNQNKTQYYTPEENTLNLVKQANVDYSKVPVVKQGVAGNTSTGTNNIRGITSTSITSTLPTSNLIVNIPASITRAPIPTSEDTSAPIIKGTPDGIPQFIDDNSMYLPIPNDTEVISIQDQLGNNYQTRYILQYSGYLSFSDLAKTQTNQLGSLDPSNITSIPMSSISSLTIPTGKQYLATPPTSRPLY